MDSFIGRNKELEMLKSFLKKKTASFIVIRGRRRIGKSRLIQEFGKALNLKLFSGLPIKKTTTIQSQIDEFTEQMARTFDMPKLHADDWGEVFWHLGRLTEKGRVLLALDEISWIGSKDQDFLGKLKNAWDLQFSKNPKLILIVCGSVSSWIQKNILSSTGFVGRVSLDLILEELPISRCTEFWGARRFRIDPYEILKILSVTGGIPRYLEEILPELPAEENIQRLCFNRGGLLYREFDQIFSDLFSKKMKVYANIVEHLANGPSDLNNVCSHLGIKKSGSTSRYLCDLMQAGFISEDPTWDLKTRNISNLKKYRLSDNYLRFYSRCILPNKERIAKGVFRWPSSNNLPGWDAIMGLQFENLVLKNCEHLFDRLGISTSDVIMFGPFFQRGTKRRKGCQIDLLIQTRYRTLYLCEIKFYANEIGIEVIEQIKKKQKNLSYPKGFSIRPVLICVNGITEKVGESEYFDKIIDFSSFLRMSNE